MGDLVTMMAASGVDCGVHERPPWRRVYRRHGTSPAAMLLDAVGIVNHRNRDATSRTGRHPGNGDEGAARWHGTGTMAPWCSARSWGSGRRCTALWKTPYTGEELRGLIGLPNGTIARNWPRWHTATRRGPRARVGRAGDRTLVGVRLGRPPTTASRGPDCNRTDLAGSGRWPDQRHGVRRFPGPATSRAPATTAQPRRHRTIGKGVHMLGRSRTAIKFFVYGLVIGLLFAPRSGEETRSLAWSAGLGRQFPAPRNLSGGPGLGRRRHPRAGYGRAGIEISPRLIVTRDIRDCRCRLPYSGVPACSRRNSAPCHEEVIP